MHKLSRFFLVPVFFILGSCFATRENQRLPAHPVETTLDTIRLPEVVSDTVSQPVYFSDTIRPTFSGVAPGDTLIPAHATDIQREPLVPVAEAIIPGDTAILLAEQDTLPATITIIGTGDIMPGTNFPDDRYLPPGNDCHMLFEPVREILSSADITFGNLEGVFCAEGGTPKDCKDPEVCYVFRMPDETLGCILDAGYDLLSVANNHVNDFGYEGRLSTARLLSEAAIPFAGFLEKPSDIFQAGGLTIGFAAFAPNRGTMDMKDYQGAAAIVAGLDTVCDLVIVSFHGGAEGADHQHTPCTDEEYLGYNRGNVCHFAHTVVNAGADLVFGHGPHVTRAMELYNDRLICYSLGNFCTYRRFNLRGPNGIAPIVKVETDREGRFVSGRVFSVYQPGSGGPRPDPQNRAVRLLQELTAADFPETPLIIEEDGSLRRK